MTMATYITREFDTVDYIAWKYYGSTANRVTERVLEANPGLAEHGPALPEGLSITLPEIATPSKTTGVKLWD